MATRDIATAVSASPRKRKLFRAAIALTALLAGLLIGVLSVHAVLQAWARRANAIASPPGIEWSGFVDINGEPQWLLVRGENAANPLLLFLHGGPGIPETLLAGRRYSAGIERHFVVVHWEQRGAGKSYRTELERTPVTTEQLTSDLETLTRYLLARYHRDKLYLVGHSWGSLLGVIAITNHPEHYSAFVGVGQVVNTVEQERLSLASTLDYLSKVGDTKAYSRLAAFGAPPYQRPFDAIMAQRMILMRSGGSLGPGFSIGRQIWDALIFPHYGLLDLWRYYKGSMFSLRSAYNEHYWSIALDRTHLRFHVPVYLVLGRLDRNTPFELAERYFDAIEAPRKEKVVFDDAAHMLPFEEPARFNRELVRLLVPAP